MSKRGICGQKSVFQSALKNAFNRVFKNTPVFLLGFFQSLLLIMQTEGHFVEHGSHLSDLILRGKNHLVSEVSCMGFVHGFAQHRHRTDYKMKKKNIEKA